jgi:hypothetical protein
MDFTHKQTEKQVKIGKEGKIIVWHVSCGEITAQKNPSASVDINFTLTGFSFFSVYDRNIEEKIDAFY